MDVDFFFYVLAVSVLRLSFCELLEITSVRITRSTLVVFHQFFTSSLPKKFRLICLEKYYMQ